MKNFSYQKDFNRHAQIVRVGDNDVKINYAVIVGDPNTEGNNPKEFLGGEFVESPNFTTWQDAQNAKEFAECLLLVVDQHAQKKALIGNHAD